jgi:hypothetical protein
MANWTWKEIEQMWQHPDLTARELHEIIPRHTPHAIRDQRRRMGRWHRRSAPLCCRCEERPVWMESPIAKRYGLCKGCYLDEERMRLQEDAKADALKQMRRRARQRRSG